MKIFISADIEGTAGITDWDETIRTQPDWHEFRALMTAEVVAACDGALAAGATEITIKDAHDSARNLILDQLPPEARVIRGWPGHPDGMMFGLTGEFAAAIYTGYHAKAGSEDNPLAHTSNSRISRLILNGEVASEFTVNALCAGLYDVPSAFIAGDAGICADAKTMLPGIATVATMRGIGAATDSLSPARARDLIREGVEQALRGDLRTDRVPSVTGPWNVVVEFNNPIDAEHSRWYPGATNAGPRAVGFASDDFFEILRALRFIK